MDNEPNLAGFIITLAFILIGAVIVTLAIAANGIVKILNDILGNP